VSQNSSDLPSRCWLANQLVHPTGGRSLFEGVLRVPSDCHYIWLVLASFLVKCSNIFGGLVAVHEGHVAVGQDETVSLPLRLGLDLGEGLHPVESPMDVVGLNSVCIQ